MILVGEVYGCCQTFAKWRYLLATDIGSFWCLCVMMDTLMHSKISLRENAGEKMILPLIWKIMY